MRLVYIILLILLLSISQAEELLDKPIDFMPKEDKYFNDTKNIMDNIDIEKFIKDELDINYVLVSLDECIDYSLKNNFDIEISRRDYYSYHYEYQNSLSKFLPMLSNTSYISDYGGQILVGGVLRDKFHETALSVNFTIQHELTKGGRQVFEAKASKYFAKSKRHNLNYTKSLVLYLTSKYYFEMLNSKLDIEIYLRNLIERNAQLTYANNLKKSGFGTNFDVIRSNKELQEARVNLIKALNKFKLSQTKLANIMGIDVNISLMPVETEIKPMYLVDKNKKVETFISEAIQYREDLKSYLDIISYNKQLKNASYTDFLPKPLVNFQQQFQGTVDTSVRPNYIVAGYLFWQPGENTVFGTLTKIKSQKEKIKARILEYEKLTRDIKEQIINAKTSDMFLRQEMYFSKNKLDFAKESIRLAILRFNHGKGILLDVIEAQSEATQAKVDYVSTIIKFNICQLKLLYESGLINKDDILKNYKP